MITTTLSNGVEMPMLGCGVFQTPPDQTAAVVREAIEVGYRLIDTAQAYANEEGVGQGIKAAISDGLVTRGEIFLTTKIWPSNMNEARAAASIDESLRKLDTDYLDLLLIHQPIGDYPGAWRALTAAYKAGKVRAIGVSNFYPDRLVDIASLTEVPPMVNQIETHPYRQAAVDHEVMAKLGIVHEAWAPFAEGQNGIFTDPVLTTIGRAHEKTAGQVALRALIQEGIVVIPKTVHRARMEENFDVLDFELTDEELATFRGLDDGTFPRIFDHRNPETIGWLITERIKKAGLGGGHLY